MTATATRTLDPARVLDQAIEGLNTPGAALPLDDVDRALNIAPRDPRLWHVKGLMHREQEKRELAVPALKRAVELAPGEPLIVHGYAQTLLEAGLPSVDAYSSALKLNRNNPAVIKGFVAALVAERRTNEAIEGLELALRSSPLWVDGHRLLAELRWSEGERAGFARSFDEALAEHPASLELRREQFAALAHAEQWDEVDRWVAEGRLRFGEHALFTTYNAILHSERGEHEKADLLFSQLPVHTVSVIDIRRVRHLLRTGRPDQAAAVLEHWLQTPEQDAFWTYAATAWRLTGDTRSDWLESVDRFVGVHDIADRLPPLEELAATLRRLHNAQGQPLAQSVRGGTQTDGNLFHRIEPIIVELREAMRSVVAEHAAALPPVDSKHPLLRWRPQRIQFTGAWSVRLEAGGSHANHVHPMGWLSSALYIVLPPDLGRDHAGWLKLGEPQAQLGLDLAPTRMVEPKLGRLALFPSWMWHGTRAFDEGERMTVAFDVARENLRAC